MDCLISLLTGFNPEALLKIARFAAVNVHGFISRIRYNELIFQLVLHLIVLVFDAYDRKHPHMEQHELFFFANHAFGALVINYVLLARYLYPKKYLQFFVFCVAIVILVMIIEESVLERIFFPDTRGKYAWSGVFGPGAFYTLLDVLPPIFILCGFKFAWDALRKQNEVDTLTSAVRESELQFLNSQINPHFLFNNLNNLYSYAIKNDPETPKIILELSEVLRYMLYDCKASRVTLSREVEQLTNFINLGKLQIKDRGTVTINTEGHLSDYEIAPLILIIFVENAFKHSTSSQSDHINIVIELSVNQTGIFRFVCRNTFEEQSNVENLASGIGLENVKTRLGLIYPDVHELRILSEEGMYQVELTIDLNQTPGL